MPWQLIGLTDDEGGLNYYLSETDHIVKLKFKVIQKKHSESILYELELQKKFNCSIVVIYNRKTNTNKYHVTALSL